MTVPVTVITASLPHRNDLLEQARQSVADQTLGPVRHLVDVDPDVSVAVSRNRLLERVVTEWVAFLDDDDLLDPHHIETLLVRARQGDVDVVASYCRFDGPPLPTPACCTGFCNRPFVLEDLRSHGIFPITVLARRQALADAGDFRLEDTWEDWSLWNRMADLGSRFVTLPDVTWTYVTAHAEDRRTTHISNGTSRPLRSRSRRVQHE